VDHLIGRFVPTITPTAGAGRPAPETSVDGQGNTGQEDHDLVGR
jgi:hypothetical protein